MFGPFSGSRLGSLVTSVVTQSRVHFVDCKGIFTPHTSYLGTKKYHSFTKSRTCGGLKKTPSSAKYVTRLRPPSVPECPTPPGSIGDSRIMERSLNIYAAGGSFGQYKTMQTI